jgi:hypothetical protein
MNAVWDELMRIWREARDRGEPPRWGQRRLAGRHVEFDLGSDCEMAAAVIDAVIANRRGPLEREREMQTRLAAMAGAMLASGHYPPVTEAVAARMIEEAKINPVAWDACRHLAEDYIAQGKTMPMPLRFWASRALPTRANARRSGRNATRDDAIRFAIGAAFESGAFGADDVEGVCELVAQRLAAAGIGIPLPAAAIVEIWKARRHEGDPRR